MLKEILLLTGQASQQVALARLLQAHNPALSFRAVVTDDQLRAIDPATLRHTRLLAFTSGVIVPRYLLNTLGFGAYNFHPGPPNYPGWAPAHFALYEGAATFGATAHEMIARVDAGRIVGIERFDMPANVAIRELEQIAFIRLAYLFWRLSPKLASDAPLPSLPVNWGGQKSTRAMYADMCRMPSHISASEMARRIRAFSDDFRGMHPTITINGFDFRCVDSAPVGPQAPDNDSPRIESPSLAMSA